MPVTPPFVVHAPANVLHPLDVVGAVMFLPPFNIDAMLSRVSDANSLVDALLCPRQIEHTELLALGFGKRAGGEILRVRDLSAANCSMSEDTDVVTRQVVVEVIEIAVNDRITRNVVALVVGQKKGVGGLPLAFIAVLIHGELVSAGFEIERRPRPTGGGSVPGSTA